jgi:glycine cleavage system aminomethyltransferase T
LSDGTEVQVDVLGELVPAVVSADALYDPANERVRS